MKSTSTNIATENTSHELLSDERQRLIRLSRTVSKSLCIFSLVFPVLGTVGWIFNVPLLARVHPTLPAMQPNTAASLILCAVAILVSTSKGCSQRYTLVGSFLGGIIALFGLTILGEYAFGWNLGIDRIFLGRFLPDQMFPGRPSPQAALNFVLLGSAILVLNLRLVRHTIAQVGALLTGANSLIALTGYIFGAKQLYGFPAYNSAIGISLPTSVAFICLAVAVVLSLPTRGVMTLMTSDTQSGGIARRILLSAFLIPPLVGGVSRVGLNAGWYDSSVQVSLFVVVIMGIILRTTWTTVRRTEQEELRSRVARKEAELARDRIREAQERFELALRGADLATWDWNIATGEVRFNDRWAELRGLLPADVKPNVDTWISGIHPDDLPRVQKALTEYFEGRAQEYSIEFRVRTESGAWAWILDRGSVFERDEQGKPTRMAGTELDITKRKELERSLHETYASLERAQSVASIGSWHLDFKRDLLIWSDENYRIFGVPPGTPMNYRAFLACIHPEDVAYVDRKWAAALRGNSYDIEHRIVVGKLIKWVREKADLEFDQKGNVCGGVGITQDITKRKQLEDELRLSEAKASGIISISSDAIISVGEDQRIALFNEGAEKIFGYTKEEVVGAPLDLLIPERFRFGHHHNMNKFAKGDVHSRRMGERSGLIFGLRKNGEEFPADAAISKLDVGGQRVLSVFLRDITSQKRVENEQRFLAELGALLASSIDYEQILDSSLKLIVRDLADSCVIYTTDENGQNPSQRAVSRDPSKAWACDLVTLMELNRKQSSLINAAIEARRTTDIGKVEPRTIEVLVQNEEQLNAVRTLDPQSVLVTPLLFGKIRGVIVLISSTSERVFSQSDHYLIEEIASRVALTLENARLYRETQRAVRVREDVLSIVSHDLKNPLTAMGLSTQLLLRMGKIEGTQLRDFVNRTQRSIGRMQTLIGDLLDFAKIQAGTFSTELFRENLSSVVSPLLDVFQSLADSKRLQLDVALPQRLPMVMCDASRIGQVLSNLFGNAIKFTPEGGIVRLLATPTDDGVLVSVSDTGPGIPPEHLSKVFDRYWQAKETKQLGSGLGLAIASGIIRAHGTKIWVESQVGKGSQFCFTLPLATSETRVREVTLHPLAGVASGEHQNLGKPLRSSSMR